MQKNSLFRPAIILTMICLVTVGLVALTFSVTLANRERQAEIKANADRKLLFPDATSFTLLTKPESSYFLPGLVEAYSAEDAGGNLLGYLVTTKYRGYGSDVPVLFAFSTDGAILRLKVLANDETPGLGKKVEKDSFLEQFIGLDLSLKLSVKTSATGYYIIDAISGATISSRAITEAANIALQYMRDTFPEVK
jgi:Na+-translocating ferredoxin:NAD+ oxidoreductase subunit G